MTEEKTGEGPKLTRRQFLKKAGRIAGGILVGAAGLELAACQKGEAPKFGEYKDNLYYTVKLEHLEEEYGHIREEAHMQGKIKGEIPTKLGLTVDNVRKVYGSSTGAAHEITTYEDGQSTGLWWEGDWPSKENTKIKIHGYVSSQFTTKVGESYDKPKE